MNKRGSKTKGKEELIKNALKSGVLSLGITMVLLLFLSLGVSSGAVSAKLSDSLMIAVVIMATTVGGIFCASRQGGGVITAGALSSVMYMAAMVMLSMLLPKLGDEGGLLLRVLIAAVAGGTFGGVLKLNRKSKKSKLRKR